jgi:hypothetical protein
LEHLKCNDDPKVISSSVNGGSAILSTTAHSTMASSGSNVSRGGVGGGGGMGFLDEIKKLAERRACENSLITDTLNKTRPGTGTDRPFAVRSAINAATATKIGKQLHPDDEKRKQHG